MTTVTKGATTLTPILVLGFESTQQSGNIIHPVLGTSTPSVSYAPASLRAGTFEFLVATLAIAEVWRAIHTTSGVFTLYDADESLTVNYIPSGDIKVSLDPETDLWTVSIAWQEVIP